MLPPGGGDAGKIYDHAAGAVHACRPGIGLSLIHISMCIRDRLSFNSDITELAQFQRFVVGLSPAHRPVGGEQQQAVALQDVYKRQERFRIK